MEAETLETVRKFSEDEFIPVEFWGRDHWSLLGYIGHLMIELAGFQVGLDSRMRQNRRNWRVMAEQCPKPKRVSTASTALGCIYKPEYKSRLRNAESFDNHDDWACVQDMVAEGFFNQVSVEPSMVLTFSERGMQMYEALNRHKMAGGTFSTFYVER